MVLSVPRKCVTVWFPHGVDRYVIAWLNCGSVSVKRRLRTADCRPGVKCRLCVKCRLQTEIKTQDGVKCRLSINCSRGLVERFNKGKKDPANTCNRTLTCLLDDISFHKSIPFFSGTSSTTQKHNRNLEPFLNLTLRLKTRSFRYCVTRDRQLVQHHHVYA